MASDGANRAAVFNHERGKVAEKAPQVNCRAGADPEGVVSATGQLGRGDQGGWTLRQNTGSGFQPALPAPRWFSNLNRRLAAAPSFFGRHPSRLGPEGHARFITSSPWPEAARKSASDNAPLLFQGPRESCRNPARRVPVPGTCSPAGSRGAGGCWRRSR